MEELVEWELATSVACLVPVGTTLQIWSQMFSRVFIIDINIKNIFWKFRPSENQKQEHLAN